MVSLAPTITYWISNWSSGISGVAGSGDGVPSITEIVLSSPTTIASILEFKASPSLNPTCVADEVKISPVNVYVKLLTEKVRPDPDHSAPPEISVLVTKELERASIVWLLTKRFVPSVDSFNSPI